MSLLVETAVPAQDEVPVFTDQQEVGRLTLKDSKDHHSFSGATLDSAGFRLKDHAGLLAALRLASGLVNTDFVCDRLTTTFVRAKRGENVTREDVRNTFRNGVKVIIVHVEDENLRAFHAPPDFDTGGLAIPVNNMFLNEKDFVDLLPVTQESQWMQKERNGVFGFAWWIMHELAHMAASILYHQGKIQDHVTPTEFVAFHDAHNGGFITDAQGNMVPTKGERGLWLEAAIGGLIEILAAADGEHGADAIFLVTDAADRRCKVPESTVNAWLANDINVPLDLSDAQEVTISDAEMTRLKHKHAPNKRRRPRIIWKSGLKSRTSSDFIL